MTTRGVAVVLTALLLAGCGSAAKPAATSTTSATKAAQSTVDTAFLTRVRASVTGGDDAGIIKAGHDSCDAISKGATTLDATERLMASGFSTHDAAVIVTAAQATYCK